MEYNEYKSLVKKVDEAARAYYDRDDPIISDYEYDELMQQIREFEAAHTDQIDPKSPTQRVAGSQGKSTFAKVEHKTPMLSLPDVFEMNDVTSFVRNVVNNPFGLSTKFCVEEKIDGLSLTVLYSNGELVRAETRGDGFIGEDVTENAKYIRGIPTYLEGETDGIEELEVRFEVYLPVERFLEINKEREENGEKLFANPRNAAAGLLRTKDLSAVKGAGLCAFAFNVQSFNVFFHDEYPFGRTHTEDLALLRRLGISTVTSFCVNGTRDVMNVIECIGERKHRLPYWIDGAVVKIDNIDLRSGLGTTGKYPRWAIAFKYPPEEKETVVRNIILQTGRTGRVTPVAEFDPVFLAGTKVSKATLHNPEFIASLDIGLGDTIKVRKAAEIIPEVLCVTKKDHVRRFNLFEHVCPSCGGKLVPGADENGNDESGAYCTNPNCPAQFSRHVEFFASRDCMDIRGMGTAVVDKLIQSGHIRSIPDIYRLSSIDPIELETILGGKKTRENLLKAIETSKDRDIDRLIKALGIEGVGRHIGKVLAKTYPNLMTIGEIPMSNCSDPIPREIGKDNKIEELAKLDGIGEISARAIVGWFSDHKNWETIFDLAKLGVNMTSKSYKTRDTSATTSSHEVSNLDGLSFVITGTLSQPREHFVEMIESAGGKVSGSVSKKTDYLLCGEAAGSKLAKAKELGVQILSEENFLKLCAGE